MSSLRDADEWELVDRARRALGKAAMLPLGPTARAIQWTAYETLKAESGEGHGLGLATQMITAPSASQTPEGNGLAVHPGERPRGPATAGGAAEYGPPG